MWSASRKVTETVRKRVLRFEGFDKIGFCYLYRVKPYKMHYSSHLQWMIIRNNNAYLMKKRNISKPFSTEPNNLTNLNSYRYNGLVHRKSVGIVAAPDNKGFTAVIKRPKATFKPAKSNIRVTWKAGPRRSLYKLKKMLNKSNYRKDLIKAAMRRASAVVRSQKPIRAKKARAKKE